MILELEVQFQLVITSVIFMMIFTNIYTFIDIVLRKIKIVLIPLYFLFSSILYYFIIYKISDGVLSIYLPVCLIIGYYLHMKFYDKYFSCVYNYLFSKLSSIINIRKDRCRKWIGQHLKKKKRKEKLTE